VVNPGDPAELAEILQDVEFSYGLPPVDWLDRMPSLRLIQFQGTGYPEPPVVAARDRGVPVAITPEGTCLGVAEHTILLILALYKHLAQAHQSMREGGWPHLELREKSFFFYGKVLGIVGLGRIGVEVIQRAKGFLPHRIVYYDMFRKTPQEEQELAVEYLDLDELLQISDIVTLHVFLSERSRGMIGARELGLMKPSAILINTSRGAVVDEEALYRALRDKKIWGAGVDAWTQEPTPPDNPIRHLDNVVCTPHMATGTVDADRLKYQAAVANFQRVLRGEDPINVVENLFSELDAACSD
jgi:D-3-phosphoglycerate dehydrogenase